MWKHIIFSAKVSKKTSRLFADKRKLLIKRDFDWSLWALHDVREIVK